MKKLGVYLLVCLFVVVAVGSMTGTSLAATASLGGDDVSIRSVVDGSTVGTIQIGGQQQEGDPYWDDKPL